MKNAILILITIVSITVNAQDCSCEANFNWLKQTFEENDAGVSYALSIKGTQAYQKHNELFMQKVKNITDPDACTQALNEWLRFFRSGHLSLRRLNPAAQNEANSTELTDAAIREHYKDSERLDIDMETFKEYLASKQTSDYEGVWVSGPYTIGIKKVKDQYVGFIIEADGVYWTKGQVKFKIQDDHTSVYYMQDHSPVEFETTELVGNNFIVSGFITLKRSFPKFQTSKSESTYFKAINAEQPYFETLDNATTYLRIPSFSGSQKRRIDSVILAHKAQILKTPNLIIDIRNNGGGSDRSFDELLPILYTDTIRTVGVEYYATKQNNQRMLDFINDPKYGFGEDGKKWAQKSYDKLSKHLGEYVNLNEHEVSIEAFDTIYKYPKNIGIIINENNGSTAEQFLLATKQSKKVKLYGTTTAGVLDISNMYFIKSPCENLELGYCLTRSMRIPGMAIDDKGIQPDFYMDKSIPKYKWLEFVKTSLNNQ